MKKITNKHIAQILYEIADILEMRDTEFKPRAYRRAAREVEEHLKDLTEMTNIKKLKEIPGVGQSIAEKIKEISETGTCEYYEQLKNTIPADIVNLMRIERVGPKTIKRLYDELGIKRRWFMTGSDYRINPGDTPVPKSKLNEWALQASEWKDSGMQWLLILIFNRLRLQKPFGLSFLLIYYSYGLKISRFT